MIGRLRRSFVLVLLVACGPRAPAGADFGGSSTGSPDAPTTTSDAVTTGEATTSSGTSTSSGATTSDTATASTGVDATTEAPRVCSDPEVMWWDDHVDCRIDWPTMTQVHGEGAAAGIAPVTLISFGVLSGACFEGLILRPIDIGDIGDIVGEFEAIHCAGLDTIVKECA